MIFKNLLVIIAVILAGVDASSKKDGKPLITQAIEMTKLMYSIPGAYKTIITDGDKLNLYGLYKQATEGDAKETCDSLTPSDNMKHYAWTTRKGLNADECLVKYAEIIKEIKARKLK